MFTRLKQYLYPPVFEDEQKTSVAQLLHRIFLIGFITVSGLLVSLLFSSGNPFFRVAVVFVAFLIVFTAFIFLHRGQVTRSSEILLYGLLALLAITLYLDGGFASPGFETLIILIFFAGFLLGQRKMLLYALFVVILIVGVFLLEQFNLLPAPISEPSPLINLVTQTANLVVVTSFAYYVFRQLQTALARTQQNQDALAQRNTQLQREIEDRKQVEGAYARSNAILQAVFEAVPDGILAVDQDGMFVAVKKRFRQMWGVPDHIHRSQPARNYVYEKLSDPTTFNQIIEESYLFPEQERKHLIELRDGSIFESFSHPQVVAGESIGRVWTYRDITAQLPFASAPESCSKQHLKYVQNRSVVWREYSA
ncbi:MAG: PAS domain-containing protein, partial [Chloroflexota bacterium]